MSASKFLLCWTSRHHPYPLKPQSALLKTPAIPNTPSVYLYFPSLVTPYSAYTSNHHRSYLLKPQSALLKTPAVPIIPSILYLHFLSSHTLYTALRNSINHTRYNPSPPLSSFPVLSHSLCCFHFQTAPVVLIKASISTS